MCVRHLIIGALALSCLSLAACRGETEETAGDAATIRLASEPIPGTPEGGLERWIGDIRSGIAPLPAMAATDPARAQQHALDLYLSRQEYIELYYGDRGRLARHPDVIDGVDAAEARFHELLRLLGRDPAPERAEVADAVADLDGRLQELIALAREAAVPLDPTSAPRQAVP
jgi:hypothetical protein